MSTLTFILGLPLLGAIAIAAIPRNYRFGIRVVALASTFASMLLAVKAFFLFPSGTSDFHFVQRVPWVASLGISYHVGADGLNIGLILMGAVVSFAAACVSWEIRKREKEFYFLLLLMTGGILGAFASLDIFFFFFFHELALIPTFIMMGVWGRGEDKNYATFQMALYLSLGALIALVGLIALYLQSGANTFDVVDLTQQFGANGLPAAAQHLIFPFLLFGFGILVSLWPFHTWAPLGYGSAPTPTAMLHAGVLKKFGLYGLLRIALPLLPEAARAWMGVLALLCLGNIFYVGLVAMRQKDFSLLIGNSSVAHMGFAFLGIASLTLIGITGTVLVMIAHGFLAALTFAICGYLYQQTNTTDMTALSGLLRKLPFIGTVLVMAAFAGCGLPGFANFVGEVMVFFGSWSGHTAVTVVAVWGALIIGAIYMLRAARRILHGAEKSQWAEVKDATDPWRRLPFALLLASLILFGVAPRLLTDRIQPSAEKLVKIVAPASEPESQRVKTAANLAVPVRNN